MVPAATVRLRVKLDALAKPTDAATSTKAGRSTGSVDYAVCMGVDTGAATYGVSVSMNGDFGLRNSGRRPVISGRIA
jgi:hypothetical protein